MKDYPDPVAFRAWVVLCPACQAPVMVDFCGGAPLVICYNHENEPWAGHAQIPWLEDDADEPRWIQTSPGNTGTNITSVNGKPWPVRAE